MCPYEAPYKTCFLGDAFHGHINATPILPCPVIHDKVEPAFKTRQDKDFHNYQERLKFIVTLSVSSSVKSLNMHGYWLQGDIDALLFAPLWILSSTISKFICTRLPDLRKVKRFVSSQKEHLWSEPFGDTCFRFSRQKSNSSISLRLTLLTPHFEIDRLWEVCNYKNCQAIFSRMWRPTLSSDRLAWTWLSTRAKENR